MSDKPILFSAPMIRALLAGTKKQTRRLLNPQPAHRWSINPSGWYCDGEHEKGEKCCYNQSLPLRWAVADRLWVREAHAFVGSIDPGWLLYRANGYDAECERHGFNRPYPPETEVRWRPSIHMPRWASRLTLTVTNVRVQRLQDINEEDAIAEGVESWRDGWSQQEAALAFLQGTEARAFTNDGSIAQRLFYLLWKSIHGSDAWSENPWIVAVSFDVQRGNLDAMEKAA